MKGSCLCGSIAYEAHGLMIGDWGCGCTYCRKFSGSAFGAQTNVLTKNFRWLQGAELLAKFEKIPGTGARAFCSNCGSPMPAGEILEGLIAVPLGSLDEAPDLTVQAFMYQLPDWAAPLHILPAYQGAPPASFFADGWKQIEKTYRQALADDNVAVIDDVQVFASIARRMPDFEQWWATVRAQFGTEVQALLEDKA